LPAETSGLAKNGYEEQIFVRADTNVSYGSVMEVMGLLKRRGLPKDRPSEPGNLEKKAEAVN
jgi:biopolymer transport protein TolR